MILSSHTLKWLTVQAHTGHQAQLHILCMLSQDILQWPESYTLVTFYIWKRRSWERQNHRQEIYMLPQPQGTEPSFCYFLLKNLLPLVFFFLVTGSRGISNWSQCGAALLGNVSRVFFFCLLGQTLKVLRWKSTNNILFAHPTVLGLSLELRQEIRRVRSSCQGHRAKWKWRDGGEEQGAFPVNPPAPQGQWSISLRRREDSFSHENESFRSLKAVRPCMAVYTWNLSYWADWGRRIPSSRSVWAT